MKNCAAKDSDVYSCKVESCSARTLNILFADRVSMTFSEEDITIESTLFYQLPARAPAQQVRDATACSKHKNRNPEIRSTAAFWLTWRCPRGLFFQHTNKHICAPVILLRFYAGMERQRLFHRFPPPKKELQPGTCAYLTRKGRLVRLTATPTLRITPGTSSYG